LVREVRHTVDGAEMALAVTYGVDCHARVREVFCKTLRTGVELQAILHQACMAISLGLQHGATMEEFAHTLGEDEPDKAARSLIGAIVRMGAFIDRELVAT
jgi:hypothetical protein